MITIVDTIPLKPGKLADYKKFVAEFTGPRKKEYADMLARYGLHTVDVFYQKIAGVEFVIVVHQAEENAREKLNAFIHSTNPMETWFVAQLENLHDFAPLQGGPQATKALFSFYPAHA